ncbi:bifunctional DNA-formamidopyrimidine glycosylase/DNA-(apurinic or apyrimidinic site) lyase [candidate division WWE3 bacterium]|nr:bifunctional DNA-formamidopyrimidine glycosylase/DNA-(apurinic or apyrimidinic site) lyase [candidate division WWE3 bacterium]
MPELPEVQTITSDLQKHIKGATIKAIRIENNFNVSPESSDFKKLLKNTKIKDIQRVAKNIVIELNSSDFLTTHLAMTGQILFRKKDFKPDRWTRVVFDLEKEGKIGELRYTDMRMFGKVKVIKENAINELHDKYGPDPIKDNFGHEKLWEILQSKRTNVKNALLDQKLIAGIGNIYANDALWMAKIHPETKTQEVTLPMSKDLLASIKEILNESIENRGSTLSDKMYVDIFGKMGTHQENFKIYGRKECRRCALPTSFKKLNGRGTYYCDGCQEKDGQEKLL